MAPESNKRNWIATAEGLSANVAASSSSSKVASQEPALEGIEHDHAIESAAVVTNNDQKKRRHTGVVSRAKGAMILSRTAVAVNNGMPNPDSTKQTRSNHLRMDRSALHAAIRYNHLELSDIQNHLQELCLQVPPIPESGFRPQHVFSAPATNSDPSSRLLEETKDVAGAPVNVSTNDEIHKSSEMTITTSYCLPDPETLPKPSCVCSFDKVAIHEWANTMRSIISQLDLLKSCIGPATYVWGTDRSGAADQNLTILKSEFSVSMEQLSSLVGSRINGVLMPNTMVVTHKKVTVTVPDGGDGKSRNIEQHYFANVLEDSNYVELSYVYLAEDAPMLRQVVLATFDKLLLLIPDYMKAQKNDSQHDSRGLAY